MTRSIYGNETTWRAMQAECDRYGTEPAQKRRRADGYEHPDSHAQPPSSSSRPQGPQVNHGS